MVLRMFCGSAAIIALCWLSPARGQNRDNAVAETIQLTTISLLSQNGPSNTRDSENSPLWEVVCEACQYVGQKQCDRSVRFLTELCRFTCTPSGNTVEEIPLHLAHASSDSPRLAAVLFDVLIGRALEEHSYRRFDTAREYYSAASHFRPIAARYQPGRESVLRADLFRDYMANPKEASRLDELIRDCREKRALPLPGLEINPPRPAGRFTTCVEPSRLGYEQCVRIFYRSALVAEHWNKKSELARALFSYSLVSGSSMDLEYVSKQDADTTKSARPEPLTIAREHTSLCYGAIEEAAMREWLFERNRERAKQLLLLARDIASGFDGSTAAHRQATIDERLLDIRYWCNCWDDDSSH